MLLDLRPSLPGAALKDLVVDFSALPLLEGVDVLNLPVRQYTDPCAPRYI